MTEQVCVVSWEVWGCTSVVGCLWVLNCKYLLKLSWLTLRYYPGFCLEILKKSTVNL